MELIFRNTKMVIRVITAILLCGVCQSAMCISNEVTFKEMKYIDPMLESPRQWSVIDLESKGFAFTDIPENVKSEMRILWNECRSNKYEICKQKNSIDCRISIEFDEAGDRTIMYLSMGFYYISDNYSVYMLPKRVRAKLIDLFSSFVWKRYLTSKGYEYPAKPK